LAAQAEFRRPQRYRLAVDENYSLKEFQ